MRTKGADPSPEPALPTVELTQARLQLALASAQMGLWDFYPDGGRLVWDQRSATIFGTTLAEVTGTLEDVTSRLHADDLRTTQAGLDAIVKGGGSVDVEFRVRWPDGSLHWVHSRGQAVVDEFGRVERLIGTNVDVTEARRLAQERVEDAVRMSGLVAVAQALGEAQSELEVLQVVNGRGMSVMGAQGAGLCLVAEDRSRVQVVTSAGYFEEDLRADLANLPAKLDFPIVNTAMTGHSHFFDDSEALIAQFPAAEALCRQAGVEGSAEVPMRLRGGRLGALSVHFVEPRQWRAPDRELLEALAALTAQALDRVHAQQAERAATMAVRRLSETLQRSLLTAPPEPNWLQIAARYQPAAQQAQVGGDWYDAFLAADGTMTVVVGDVAGHDRDAAAAMAQARNVLRGVAQMVTGPPAEVLSALDRALHGLQVDILTTAVLCRFTDPGRLTWSNAGHPPPLVIHLDGSTELLEREPDLLLGLEPDFGRVTHEVLLQPGDTVLLYSDGLIERRGESLDDGLQRLADAARGLHELSTEAVCELLLERLATDSEDDVALLVLRTPLREPRAIS